LARNDLLPIVDFVRLRALANPLVMDFFNADGTPFDLTTLGTIKMYLNSAEDFSGTSIFGASGLAGAKSVSPGSGAVQNRLTFTPSAAQMDQDSGDYHHVVVSDPDLPAAAGMTRGRVAIKPSPFGP